MMENGPRKKDSGLFTTSIPIGCVRCTSRVKVMWLTRVRGYAIVRVTKLPKPGLFGRLQYDHAWLLRPPR